MPRIELAEELRRCVGGSDPLKGGRVVEVRETPYPLVMPLHDRGIDDANVVGVPSPTEPEVTGFG